MDARHFVFSKENILVKNIFLSLKHHYHAEAGAAGAPAAAMSGARRDSSRREPAYAGRLQQRSSCPVLRRLGWVCVRMCSMLAEGQAHGVRCVTDQGEGARQGGTCSSECVGSCPQQGALDASMILTVTLAIT